jgi:membrane-bound metal-dependent hydrolase YbcI (DUF457 family)
VLFWFAGLSVLIVWTVFQSPALDYRFVILGALLPVAEGLLGGPYVLHTLVGAVFALLLVMMLTRRRRLARRRWLGIPIGLFLHLVLDGTWAREDLFWWPFLGGAPLGSGNLPELDRGFLALVLMEVAGLLVLVWSWFRFGLDDEEGRRAFWRTGRLGPGGSG